MRTYACAVGLDPIDTVDEFCRLFPQGDRRGHATMHDIASIVATAAEFKDEFPTPERRRPAAGAPVVRAPESWPSAVAGAARQGARAAGDLFSGFTRQVKTRRRLKQT